jgi:hypothetical protein
MAQQLMWNQIELVYRGQATNGTVITVEEEAMDKAQRNAGKSVYDTDWWVETLARVLEHWGIFTKQWIDNATRTPRLHFSLGEPQIDTGQPSTSQQPTTTAPPTGPLNSGPLSSRLGTKDLGKDKP